MRRIVTYLIAAGVLLGVGAGVGILAWQWVTAGDGEASEPISAPTLDINAEPTISQEQAAAFATQAAESAAEVAALRTQVAEMAEAMAASPAEEADEAEEAEEPTAADAEADAEAEAEPQAAASASRAIFRISQDESEVRFNIDETLAGNRITVVGRTNQVAGDVLVDFDSPSQSQVGTIVINARTLRTDNESRNRAIRSSVLLSGRDEYEFIEFVPTGISGLPDSVAVGDTITFEVTGDLTVRDTTRSITFDTGVTVVTEDRLEGLASTTILYADFGVSIPNVPFNVTDIADDVILEIEFVALLAESA